MKPGLHQLAQSAATDGQVPGWDDASGLWVPGDVVRGLTSADSSVTITDNGDGTLDLAASGGGTVDSVVAGTGISVDDTDPANPIVTATGGGGGAAYHGCAANRSTTQSLAAGAAIQFNAADDWDSDTIHDPSTNNTRFTIPTGLDGVWSFRTIVLWASTSSARSFSWAINGAAAADKYRVYAGGMTSTSLFQASSVDILLAAGDYVECVSTATVTLSILGARASCQFLGVP